MKLFCRTFVAAISISVFSTFLFAAEPKFSEICKTWIGLDKSSRPKFLHQIEIRLEAADVSETEGESENTDEALKQRQLAYQEKVVDRASSPAKWQFEALPSNAVRGTLVLTPLGTNSNNPVSPSRDTIEGVYYPDIGILVFKRVGPGQFPVGEVYAVFNESATEMCLLFSGSLGNHPPLSLVPGSSLPADLRAFVEREQPSSQSESLRRSREPSRTDSQDTQVSRSPRTMDTGPSGQTEVQEIRTQFQENQKRVQAKISEAIRARDTARVAALREEQKQIRADYNRQVAEARGRTSSASQPQQTAERSRTQPRGGRGVPASASCPEHVLAWVSELDNHGASVQYFNGFIELSNLFRPSLFIPHFGKSFAELGTAELKELGYQMQLPCANDGSALARGGARIPLAGILNRPTTWGPTEMGIAGIAQDTASSWARRMQTRLQQERNIPLVEEFETHSQLLLRLLWPDEREPIVEGIPAFLSHAAESHIEEAIRDYATRLDQGNFSAIASFEYLKTSGLFERILPSELKRVKARYLDVATSAIVRSYERFKADLIAIETPRDRNAFAREWWSEGYAGIRYFEEYFDAESFKEWLGNVREEDWKRLQPELYDEIDSIENLAAAKRFVFMLSIYEVDDVYCPTWLDIVEKQQVHIAEIERKIHVARVGEGPFGPDYPGAIYLNAIYRLDREQIAEENRLLARPILDLMGPVTDSGMFRLGEALSGGVASKDNLMSGIGKISFVDPLLSFLAGSFQNYFPNCMVAPEKITETVYYETIVTDSFGTSYVSDSHSKTFEYVINGRHVDAFGAMEARPSSPESKDFFLSLFGGFIPEQAKKNAQLLSDSLRGLRQAMQDRPCDDPVIQTLDANLLTLFYEQNAR